MRTKLCYSPGETAQLIGCCKNLVYRYINNGELASFKLGQRRFINQEAIDSLRLKLEQTHTDAMRDTS